MKPLIPHFGSKVLIPYHDITHPKNFNWWKKVTLMIISLISLNLHCPHYTNIPLTPCTFSFFNKLQLLNKSQLHKET
ncbi:uncharacterized protein DS421_3g72120 [Arachis hypogaea]|nr:uncharacterized protein DS421_3g72120 [Arachis hypogaea]